ncbi:uncharacterized protein [Nicotiana sylvestris]|uniref:uncharacterized protein n=1 Tax=Nicotiana sylvestris TaxID=4096 RepID=UPI00388CB9F3
MANKRRLTEFETVALTDECSARVQSKLRHKLKDPGSFTIPLEIEKHELADRPLAVSEGIIKDMLVRVGKFIFPADSIILDYVDDEEVLIVFGRPFFATGGALIDMREGNLKMRVHDEEITFNIHKALNLPKHYKDLCMISVVESKLIEQGHYVEPTGMEKKIELEEVVLRAERVKVKEKRVRMEREEPLRVH